MPLNNLINKACRDRFISAPIRAIDCQHQVVWWLVNFLRSRLEYRLAPHAQV